MNDKNSTTDLHTIIQESLYLEQHVSELYFLFFEQFPNDANFWWQLVEEEKNHASLLRSGLEYFEPINKFPDRIVSTNLEELQAANKKLISLIKQLKDKKPDRETAFNYAYAIETSAGELHFQNFMEDISSMSNLEKIFSQLNHDDISHAKRILDYMNANNIPHTNTTFL